MAVLVRVRDAPDLVERVAAAGTQTALAHRAQISKSRLNQLVRGTRITVSVAIASRLEDALGVPPTRRPSRAPRRPLTVAWR